MKAFISHELELRYVCIHITYEILCINLIYIHMVYLKYVNMAKQNLPYRKIKSKNNNY